MWGLVFVAPLLLPDYPATLLSFGRYFAFGLVTLPIAWWQRKALRQLTRADWWLATKLSIVGNFIYYLSRSRRRSSWPVPVADLDHRYLAGGDCGGVQSGQPRRASLLDGPGWCHRWC